MTTDSALLIVNDPPGGPIEIEKQVGVVEKKRGFFHSLDALDDDHDAMIRTVGLIRTYVSSKQAGRGEKPETTRRVHVRMHSATEH